MTVFIRIFRQETESLRHLLLSKSAREAMQLIQITAYSRYWASSENYWWNLGYTRPDEKSLGILKRCLREMGMRCAHRCAMIRGLRMKWSKRLLELMMVDDLKCYTGSQSIQLGRRKEYASIVEFNFVRRSREMFEYIIGKQIAHSSNNKSFINC